MTKERNIEITVEPYYVLEQSDPSHSKFVWSYQIKIFNHTDEVIHLLYRYWKITDSTGRISEVRGAGVLGQQPLIQPGKHYIYTSYCQLQTPQGTMEGHYEMQNIHEERFEVTIPKFALSAPESITAMHKSHLH